MKMLYLLTVADSISTGPAAWNSWTAALLRDFFLKILNVLEKGELAQRKQALEREQAQLQSLLAHAHEVQQQNQNRLQTVQDFADFSQRMLGTLENRSEEVKRDVIRLLVDHIVVEDDAIVIHHIVPITENGRLSLKHNHRQKPLRVIPRVFDLCLYPRWESNPGFWLRRPTLYPLSYGGVYLMCGGDFTMKNNR